MRRFSWMRTLKLFLFSPVLFYQMGCQNAQDDSVAKAQACLDSATPATASVCTAMVAGINTSKAAVIRCSADFITQGFTSSRFASAFTQLKNTPSGTNASVAMMSYLTFNASAVAATNVASVAQAVTDCTATGLPGMIMFANFSSMATNIANTAGLVFDPANPPTPAALQAALNGLSSASDATLGQSALAISGAYCGSASTQSADFCTQINAASAAGGAAAVGAKIRCLMHQPPTC